jgi:hypothetical protein
VIRTWLATGTSGLGGDGAASFRTFLTRTFLVLARARGATASEDRFRLGSAWQCSAEFALYSLKEEVHSCRREPQGQLARSRRVSHHRSPALGHLLAAEIRDEPQKRKYSSHKFRKAVCSFSDTGPLLFWCWLKYVLQLVQSALEDSLKGTAESL